MNFQATLNKYETTNVICKFVNSYGHHMYKATRQIWVVDLMYIYILTKFREYLVSCFVHLVSIPKSRIYQLIWGFVIIESSLKIHQIK